MRRKGPPKGPACDRKDSRNGVAGQVRKIPPLLQGEGRTGGREVKTEQASQIRGREETQARQEGPLQGQCRGGVES